MGIGETARAPADQGRDRELSVGRRGGAGQSANDEEQDLRKSDDSLLPQGLEKLVVRIAGLESLPARHALDVRPVAVLEPAGTDPEDRMIANHPQRIAPHDDALPERRSLLALIDRL